MKFFTNRHKYKNANLWIEQSQIREEKKLAVKQVLIPHDTKPVSENVVVSPIQTVFRKEELGRNTDDANKLKTLYRELEDIVRLPTWSLT